MRVEQLIERGLPAFAAEELAGRGIATLEPLQKEAVRAGLFEGKNLVIMAPTSSGKTLVSELAAAYHATHRSGSVMVTSLKALAYEKYLTFRENYSRHKQFHFHTSIATGDEVTDETAADHVALIVATYEKWYYTLVERPLSIRTNSLLIIDEMQMLGDPHRGDKLEALITFVRMKAPDTQIIGLSATFPNAPEVAEWLGATLVSVTGRPVRLTEEIWTATTVVGIDRDSGGPCSAPPKLRPIDSGGRPRHRGGVRRPGNCFLCDEGRCRTLGRAAYHYFPRARVPDVGQ